MQGERSQAQKAGIAHMGDEQAMHQPSAFSMKHLFRTFSCLKHSSRASFASLQTPQNLATGCSS